MPIVSAFFLNKTLVSDGVYSGRLALGVESELQALELRQGEDVVKPKLGDENLYIIGKDAFLLFNTAAV
jgi:hypothetical protein